MLIYTHSHSKRKKPSAKSVQLREERKQMFASVLKGRKAKFLNNMPDLSCASNAAPLSNNLAAADGYKRSVDDWQKWQHLWVSGGGVWVLHTSAENSIRKLKNLGVL
jgi:hypothetical protein